MSGTDCNTVFLSYSRDDAEFRHKLAVALSDRGFAPIFDTSEQRHEADPTFRLAAGDEWWKQLQSMIVASDAMIFIVTPSSIASDFCGDEIAYARSMGKRVIPILRGHVSIDDAPERLKALDIRLDFRSDEGVLFDAALDQLIQVLEYDIDWYRAGALYLRRARLWDAESHVEDFLLRDGEVARMEAWLARQPADAPPLSQLLHRYLEQSKAHEEAGRKRLGGLEQQLTDVLSRLRGNDSFKSRLGEVLELALQEWGDGVREAAQAIMDNDQRLDASLQQNPVSGAEARLISGECQRYRASQNDVIKKWSNSDLRFAEIIQRIVEAIRETDQRAM